MWTQMWFFCCSWSSPWHLRPSSEPQNAARGESLWLKHPCIVVPTTSSCLWFPWVCECVLRKWYSRCRGNIGSRCVRPLWRHIWSRPRLSCPSGRSSMARSVDVVFLVGRTFVSLEGVYTSDVLVAPPGGHPAPRTHRRLERVSGITITDATSGTSCARGVDEQVQSRFVSVVSGPAAFWRSSFPTAWIFCIWGTCREFLATLPFVRILCRMVSFFFFQNGGCQ